MEPQKPSSIIPTNGSRPSAGTTIARRDGMGGEELTRRAETASDFVAAQAKASVEARYLVAMRQRRDLSDVRGRLLASCQHPAFAEESLYRKPIGEGVEGLSIRFVEAALQLMGNINCNSFTVYDDMEKRIVRVVTQDLESNVTYDRDITVDKTVERKDLRGATPISKRMNSQGQITYRIGATDDDVFNKEMALVSKTIRSLGLRLIPADIKGECEAQIRRTLADKHAKDPQAEQKKIADSFAGLNVMPKDLADYLGHPMSAIVAKDLTELRALYTAIRDGEATWVEALEHRQQQRRDAPPPTAASEPTPAADESGTLPTEAAVAPVAVETKPAAPPAAPKPTTASELAGKLKAEGKRAPKAAPAQPPKVIDIQVEAQREPGDDSDDAPIR